MKENFCIVIFVFIVKLCNKLKLKLVNISIESH